MTKKDCIFCKLANGEIPTATVYEDEDFRAIMDISPAARGHVIILTKEHAANIYELSDELASKIFVVAKKIAKAVKEEIQCDGVNILQNNGDAAGQSFFHIHVHVIPRYTKDTVVIGWRRNNMSGEDFDATARAIASHIE